MEPELRPQLVSRVLEVDGSQFRAFFSSPDLRGLRVSVSSFLELVQVSAETIEAFAIDRA